MRGTDHQTGPDVQLREPGDDGTAGPSVARDPPAGECGAGWFVVGFQQDVFGDRSALDSARATASGTAATGVLHGALGVATDGAIDLHLDVSLVRGAVDGRAGVGCDGVHQACPRA
jgi:hypothetical protein